jgi:hypothetical protein
VSSACLHTGGWFSPHELTPARFIDTFEKVNELHPGFRRNHAKGVCIGGYFESNGQGVRLSRASVFQPGRMAVIGLQNQLCVAGLRRRTDWIDIKSMVCRLSGKREQQILEVPLEVCIEPGPSGISLDSHRTDWPRQRSSSLAYATRG